MIELKRNSVTTARMIAGKLDTFSRIRQDDHGISIKTITTLNEDTPPIVLLHHGFVIEKTWRMDMCVSKSGTRYFYPDDKELIIADGGQKWRNNKWIH